MDSVLREESFSSYWYEMRVRWLASPVFGSALGAVGGSIERPGVDGLLARLTVPLGAAVEMMWLPRWSSGLGTDALLTLVRLAVGAAAAVAAGLIVARFFATRRHRRPERHQPGSRRAAPDPSPLA